jgi:1,2-diacylglycerol 3-beta-glucosyltransferase
MILFVVAVILLIPATVAALHAIVLAVAARFHRSPHPTVSRRRYAVLVPAHDEEISLPATLRSLAAADYPPDLVTPVVVADNCSDRTAAVAGSFGATVLERTSSTERGKGYALRHGLETILRTDAEAVLILDADCQVEPELFRRADAWLDAGADALQVAVRTRNADDGPTGFVGAVGNAFDNLYSAGKDRLGVAVPLRGSGMIFRRSVIERFPWTEFGLVEDADYAARLRAGGVRVRFEPRELVRSESPARQADLYQQRRRWRAALFGGSGLLARWVESKPLVLAQLALTGVAVAAAGSLPLQLLYLSIVLLTVGLYLRVIGIVGLSRKRLAFLAASPGIVARLALLALGGVAKRDLAWQRTRRAAEPARN